MALFLTDHSSDKVMLLGQWKSRAFLVYIRPQVTELCNLYSIDIISFNHYFELFATTSQYKSKLKGNTYAPVHVWVVKNGCYLYF